MPKKVFPHLIKGFPFQDSNTLVHSQGRESHFLAGGNTSFDPPPLSFLILCLLITARFFHSMSPLLLLFLFFYSKNTVTSCCSEALFQIVQLSSVCSLRGSLSPGKIVLFCYLIQCFLFSDFWLRVFCVLSSLVDIREIIVNQRVSCL